MSLTFIVGTSRCGSTMLSRILGMHQEVLSLSEFWNCFLDARDNIPTHDMSGEEFWQIIAEPAPAYDGLVLAGIKQDEGLYPFPSRFNYVTGMPPFCRVLAWLTGDPPDPLYDEIAREASKWPRRPMAEHCRALFADLADRLGRRVVVERTGGGLSQIALLREQFPEARFVFLHRDGPASALSMSRYPTLRLSAMKILAAAISGSPPADLKMLPAEIRATKPEEFKGLISPPFDKDRFLTYPIPLSYFGWMWSLMTRIGTREIRRVQPGEWMTLRYENVLASTTAELTSLADFIGIPATQQWLDRACKFIDPGRANSADQLQSSELAALEAVCEAGTHAFDLLDWEFSAGIVRQSN